MCSGLEMQEHRLIVMMISTQIQCSKGITRIMSRVITRFNTITGIAYRDDPTIMASGLMNEPRCQVDYSGRTITAWVQEMATYVKALDGKHLLEIGMEGFYGDSLL
ncbi:unnamed protein product [Ilex paraguariensis]|uniref:mannan endo-1,4-beta-mannosidase n=1 Tax=Ilex paraguariensis TaxID=185542 RepID=A0ABC8SYN1_9AQUA